MRILQSDDVSLGRADRVFRHSRATDLIAAVALLVAATAIAATAWFAIVPLVVGGFASVSLAFFAMVALGTYRRAANPDNWLLTTDGTRILIQVRSHLNRGSPEDRSRVIELGSTDIVGFRVTRSRTTGHTPSGDPAGGVAVFLDIHLRGQTDAIAAAIREERERRPRGRVWRRYPVTLPHRDTLRLEWRGRYARIAPGIDEALRVLTATAPASEPNVEHVDLGTSGRAPANADVERQIGLLVDQGKIMDATVLAARALDLNQSEARGLIEAISHRKVVRAPDHENGSAV